ncbi:dTDP-4-dehydrorhamnose reductase [Fulvimarina endophytica]|uniref:dTDP-4-dehydrorhamnose reductase n=1 Tax=Fulvimarina endophytica TaxID=2293836 RepID=A0A371X3C3_9HYPH|nr:dTDP-4-dehydrorhamnose reductase [Fulvimarina endophytica]RFC63730.1 dTDP-4-dehydrorhamnose reductase [Fulvimarina endophytica]
MRLLVTGREGQVATALKEKGAARGVSVTTLGRPDLDLSGPREAIVEAVLKAADGASAIVSAAAYTAVDRAESEPELARAVNAQGAGALAEAARRLAIPILHLSTDYVYDGSKAGPWMEEDATGPLGVYGRSKLEGEAVIRASGARHVILRTAWVYSPFGQNFVKTMLRLGAERDKLSVVDDQRGSPTSALDIADAVLAIAERLDGGADDASLHGTFHLAGSGETSWAGFARAIFEGAGRRGLTVPEVAPIPTSAYPTPAERPKNSVLSTDRLHARYGLRLPDWRTSLETVLDRLIEGPGPKTDTDTQTEPASRNEGRTTP